MGKEADWLLPLSLGPLTELCDCHAILPCSVRRHAFLSGTSNLAINKTLARRISLLHCCDYSTVKSVGRHCTAV
jgi:hypothetical protein